MTDTVLFLAFNNLNKFTNLKNIEIYIKALYVNENIQNIFDSSLVTLITVTKITFHDIKNY